MTRQKKCVFLVLIHSSRDVIVFDKLLDNKVYNRLSHDVIT